MARKTRKSQPLFRNNDALPKGKEKDRAGLYVRISVENERKRESNSIGTQIQLLKDYVEEHDDLEIGDIYCDDDISGTDFNRPEFSRMLNDARNGEIDCIIVKDLSRLGRNFLESGEYIEMVFPFLGIRFISVTDRFDTKNQSADISVQIKNMANEMYARDISRKICSTIHSMQEQGKYVGSRAPYGYLLDPADRHHLIVDPETMPVVQKIFKMLADGNTIHYIAVSLNESNIPSPGRRLYNLGLAKGDKFKNSKWFQPTVRRILSDEIYLGWTVSGKYRSEFLDGGKKGSVSVPREKWNVTKGTHEPIVTEQLFREVQKYFEYTKGKGGLSSKNASKGRNGSIMRGHLVCGECGHNMQLRTRNSHGKKSEWYICVLHDGYNSSYCTKKGVKREFVEETALRLIQMQIRLFLDARNAILDLNQQRSGKTRYRIYQEQIRNTKGRIERFMELKAALYTDYTEGRLTEEEYLERGQDYAAKADDLRIFLAELEKDAEKYSPEEKKDSHWAMLAEKYQNQMELDREMVEAFIQTMTLYNDGHVEVAFKFRDELEKMLFSRTLRQKEAERYGA